MTEVFNDDRLPNTPIKTVDDLIAKIQTYHAQVPAQIIEQAYRFSEKAHEGQMRRSGEPYISHPLNVAGILADLKLDVDCIITGLLHDTVEDTGVTLDDVQREFGQTVYYLVDGVTKIGQMNFRNNFDKQGENIRKMIVAMGKDVRVVLVKLADRLHNMRTLNHMPYEKQERIAQETLEIYCPLAGRMGISALKIELEDLCFRYSRPDKYYELVQLVAKTELETAKYITEVRRSIAEVLLKTAIKNYKVFGRSKHYWSVYRKMTARNLSYDQIYDVLAFRIIVNSVVECYEVLGYIHSIWKPIPGRFKDFIAMPKSNNYQSLHTTVIGPGGDRIEIQIRTDEMHLVAEKGIAAHWNYKERGALSSLNQDKLQQANWLRELVSLHQQSEESEEFLDVVKTDLMEKEIYVFTPKGDVKELPDGATPVDLAYAIHTNLGGMCTGARVNGRMVPLKHELENGDRVEIMTAKTQTPSKDWLKFVVTNKAKSKIRQYVKEEQRRNSVNLGKEIVEKEFRKFGLAAAKYLKGPEYDSYMKAQGVHDVEELYAQVGYGKFEPRHLVDNLKPQNAEKTEEKNETISFMEKVVKSAKSKTKKSNSLVSVDGMDDVLVHFAKCCGPIPGDVISGFISRGKGIIIHRGDCPRVFELDQIRRVDVAWTTKTAGDGQERQVKLEVIGQDVPGLLKLMSEAFSVQGINIESAQIRTTRDKKAVCLFEVSVKDLKQLSNAVLALQKIKGIIGVQRKMG